MGPDADAALERRVVTDTDTDAAAPRLWLIRHARPLIESGVCYGRLDVSADEEHTRASARRLHAALAPGIAQIRTSPLTRCLQLAHALLRLRDTDNSPDHLDERLQEMDFGVWEGRRWDAIARDELDAWASHFTEHRPGNGESLAAMLSRVRHALGDMHKAVGPQRDMVWITHAGVIRCVLWLATHGERLPEAHEWTMAAPDFGEWISLPISALPTPLTTP